MRMVRDTPLDTSKQAQDVSNKQRYAKKPKNMQWSMYSARLLVTVGDLDLDFDGKVIVC